MIIALFIQINKQLLHLFPRPWCFSEKLEARLPAWIFSETVDFYVCAQLFPSIIINQELYNKFECFTMQGIVALLFAHNRTFN